MSLLQNTSSFLFSEINSRTLQFTSGFLEIVRCSTARQHAQLNQPLEPGDGYTELKIRSKLSYQRALSNGDK